MGLQYEVKGLNFGTAALLMAALVVMATLIGELSTKSKCRHIE